MDNSKPIAESTHIEESVPSPASPRFLWGGRFMPKSKRSLSTPSLPEPVTEPTPTRPRNIDPQVYIDTQSRGLTSRVVKYYEESQQKTRPISNPAYRRFGDFPIVNLNKTKIVLKPQQNTSAVSSVRIAPPMRANYHVTPRAVIMSGGRLGGGDGLAFSNGPHATAANENEPLVSHGAEYEAAPTSSALDALTEISRKRMHCDELDGEHKKKQRSEALANNLDNDCNNSTNLASKRVRDRTSPNYQGTPTETQKKRYKSNDIYSSLSSSLHLITPKRKLDSQSYQDEQGDLHRQQLKMLRNDVTAETQPRSPLPKPSFEKERQNGDIAPRRDIRQIEQPKIATKPPIPAPTIPKLTLFNKKYDPSETYNNNDDSDDDDRPKISFVKPKASISNVFQFSKEKREHAQRTKLSQMLSCLVGETEDDVDEPDAKTDKPELSRSETAISPVLSTATSVTFSTATTSSVLSLPATNVIPAKPTNVEETPKATEAAGSVSRSLNFNSPETTPVVSSAPAEVSKLNTSFTITSGINTGLSSAAAPVVTSTGPTVAQANLGIKSFSLASAASSADEPAPRIGGFSFSATPASATLVTSPNKLSLPPSIQATSTPSNAVSTPLFSFGVANKNAPAAAATTSNSNTLPPAGTLGSTNFTFGSSNTPVAASTNANSHGSSTVLNSTFNFGSDTKVATSTITNPLAPNPLATNTIATNPPSFSFGQTSQVANTQPSAIALPQFEIKPASSAQAPATSVTPFSFGGVNKPATLPETPATSAVPALFGFGNVGQDKATPSFGSLGASSFSNPATTSSITGIKFGEKPSSAGAPVSFQFGGAADKTPAAPAFGSSFAPTTTNTAVPVFGSNVATTTASPAGAFAFGSQNQTPTAAPPRSLFGAPETTTQSMPTFGGNGDTSFNQPPGGFLSNIAKTTEVPSFGGNNVKPTFGSSTFGSNQTPSFGSTATNQPTSLFGSNVNSSSAVPAPAFGGGGLNQTFNAASPPAFGSDSRTQNSSVFGSQTAVTTASTGMSNMFGMASTQPAGVFSFGGQAAAAAPATTAPAFGSSSSTSTFAFGSTTAPNGGGNVFGSGKPEATVSPFSFNANPSTQPATAPAFGKETTGAFNFDAKASPFGTPQTEAVKPFAFGGITNPAPNASPFGGLANGSTPTPSPFGGVPNGSAPVASPFGSSTPVFGASSALPEANKGFSFGTNMSDTSKAFAFNSGPATAPASNTSFNFNATPTNPALPTNAFQFNAATPQMGQNNVFSIGAGGGAKGRPIRQATRRMNK